MRRTVLIIASVVAVLVVGYAAYLSQASAASPTEGDGTTACASADAKTETSRCDNDQTGKPGEVK